MRRFVLAGSRSPLIRLALLVLSLALLFIGAFVFVIVLATVALVSVVAGLVGRRRRAAPVASRSTGRRTGPREIEVEFERLDDPPLPRSGSTR